MARSALLFWSARLGAVKHAAKCEAPDFCAATDQPGRALSAPASGGVAPTDPGECRSGIVFRRSENIGDAFSFWRPLFYRTRSANQSVALSNGGGIIRTLRTWFGYG